MADEVAYAALAVSIIATAPLYIDLFFRLRSGRKIDFEIEKFYEPNDELVASLYSVRILHPNRVIEHCMVYLDNERLPWWDSPPRNPNYDHKLGVSGGGNVRVPEVYRAQNPDALLIVKNGKKTLRKIKFADTPRGR